MSFDIMVFESRHAHIKEMQDYVYVTILSITLAR